MRFFTFFLLLLLSSCASTALQTELATTKTNLAKVEANLKTAQQSISNFQKEETGRLVHLVFFKLKSAQDAPAMIAEIKKLTAIPVVQDLEVGTFKDLGDARALSDYDLVFELVFENKAAYDIYQAHPIHVGLKEAAKNLLGGPPATYDFIEK